MMNRRQLVTGALAAVLVPAPLRAAARPGPAAIDFDVTLDPSVCELESLFAEVACILDRMPSSVKDEVLLRFDLPDKIGDLIRVQSITFADARELRVSFEPTERLIELLATCRASQGYQRIASPAEWWAWGGKPRGTGMSD